MEWSGLSTPNLIPLSWTNTVIYLVVVMADVVFVTAYLTVSSDEPTKPRMSAQVRLSDVTAEVLVASLQDVEERRRCGPQMSVWPSQSKVSSRSPERRWTKNMTCLEEPQLAKMQATAAKMTGWQAMVAT
ncbi:hypothetical protein QBC44DRAFT_381066 [Cladorrhinum sp. PSN332]|nr:hypothetical protein QBC44DRAFT_381066 [Cladorrhinum sp. PSN332]